MASTDCGVGDEVTCQRTMKLRVYLIDLLQGEGEKNKKSILISVILKREKIILYFFIVKYRFRKCILHLRKIKNLQSVLKRYKYIYIRKTLF